MRAPFESVGRTTKKKVCQTPSCRLDKCRSFLYITIWLYNLVVMHRR